MDPYRDDRETRIAVLERRLEEVRRDELSHRRTGRALIADSVLIAWTLGAGGFAATLLVLGAITHGVAAAVGAALPFVATKVHSRLRRPALPDRSVTVKLSVGELDLVAVVTVGADPERREAARTHLGDRSPEEVAEITAPLLDASARRVIALRGRDAPIEKLTADVRLTAMSALRDLGLEIGDLLLVPRPA